MEHTTVQQAAERQQISAGWAQEGFAQGCLSEAGKPEASWENPADAAKPKELGQENTLPPPVSGSRENAIRGLMPLMNTPFQPGGCVEYIRGIEDGPVKETAWAEYYYFSGQPEKAVQIAQEFLDCEDDAVRFSACLIFGFACLSTGRIHQAWVIFEQIRNAAGEPEKAPAQTGAANAFVRWAGAVLLHLPLPDELPALQDFLPMLPIGLRAFALYIQAHYLYLQGDYGKSAGVVEAALAMEAAHYPIPAIYLHLAAVMDYMSLMQTEQARTHLLEAWALAQPDDLIEGFGEHHGLLGGMLESIIKVHWPKDFKRIIDITYRFSDGWRKIHNPQTGHDVADELTTTEFAAAMLAARNWTNQQIAEHMNISVNTVKRHISQAMKKLHVETRKDLKQYMLQ